MDRLTTDAQPLFQAQDIDSGAGDNYDYGGVYDATNFGVGADCSGSSGIEVGIAIHGPDYYGTSYTRQYSTESFPGPFGDYFRQTSKDDLLQGNYVIKICIHHGGGGPESHMNSCIDGWVMESNGDHGTCTLGHGAIPQDSDYWNDWLVCDSTINEDTTWRQEMGYPKGFDYAGGRPSAASIKGAGGAFVCRYLTDGGPGLPGKQLQQGEFSDFIANGIAVVFNWETTADFMLGGHDAGVADSTNALNYIRSLSGAPQNPTVYFSADFDEAPNQDAPVEDYLAGARSVLGDPNVGMYGPYWICKRAADAHDYHYIWQTEAWSGGNIDARVCIMQRNALGYATIEGTQCDIDEAHTIDFGQFPSPSLNLPASQPVSTGGLLMALTDDEQTELLTKVRQLHGGQFNTDKQSQSRYCADGEVPHWSSHDLAWNDDGMIAETMVERLAIFGSDAEIKTVVRNASRGDSQAMVIIGKMADADLARNNLSRSTIQSDFTTAQQQHPTRTKFYEPMDG